MSGLSETRFGGSISIEVMILYVSDVILTNGKKRKELFVNSDEGVLVRITLWDKFADEFKFKAKQLIEFRNLRVVSYLGKSLNSCAATRFSEIEKTSSLGKKFLIKSVNFYKLMFLKDVKCGHFLETIIRQLRV